jgi:hypothetical protein
VIALDGELNYPHKRLLTDLTAIFDATVNALGQMTESAICLKLPRNVSPTWPQIPPYQCPLTLVWGAHRSLHGIPTYRASIAQTDEYGLRKASIGRP